MNIVITSQASIELKDAIEYYDECGNSLGSQFLNEFESVVNRIKRFPEAWPLIAGTKRKCLFNRFPFCVIYSIEKEYLLILAIMHLRQKPRF